MFMRPDMYVDVEFRTPSPQGLSIPAQAVLDSGMQKIVYLETSDGVFEPRAVELVREQLKTGPKLASDLIAQGAEIGLSKKTIWRAGEELQVQKVQRGLSNTIEWSLPT